MGSVSLGNICIMKIAGSATSGISSYPSTSHTVCCDIVARLAGWCVNWPSMWRKRKFPRLKPLGNAFESIDLMKSPSVCLFSVTCVKQMVICNCFSLDLDAQWPILH